MTTSGRAITIASALLLAGCQSAPERHLQVQGTVTSVGYAEPIAGATVLIDWPPALGGGSSQLATDGQGRYAVSRTIRTDTLMCAGLTITVRAPGFASVYSRRDSTAAVCGDSVLTENVRLFPLQE